MPEGEGAVYLTGEERAWLAAHPIIRVHNEKDWPPFNYFEYGSPRGLSIDYMDLLADILGIEVEYVTGPSWKEFLGLIKRKELDVMLNIVKTEDRMKYLLYTEPYIKNPNTIVSSQEHPYETLQALFGKTVAFPKGFFYEEVLTKSFPQIKRLPVEDVLASLKAVSFGKADAALGEEAVVRTLIKKNLLSGLRISGEVDIGDPDLPNLRLGVRDDWPLLQSALMKAMAVVTPVEMNRIRQKWIARATDEEIQIPLTDAERKWLAEHRDLRLGVDPAWPPFEFIDKSGHYAGIGSGFIDAISDRLNIKMKPISGLTWSQVIEKAKAGEIDVLPAVMRTSERDKYLNFTKPYLSFPIVIAINKNIPFIGSIKGLEGYRVGVVKDYSTEDILRHDHPYLKLVTYPTLEEALQELDTGRIDALVDNMITITQEIARSGLKNTRISASTEYTYDLSLGVHKDLPELIGILNKVIDDISSQEKAAITSTWMSDVEVKIRFDFKAILAWAIPIGASIFLIIAFVVVWNRRLGREISQRKQKEKLIMIGAQISQSLTVGDNLKETLQSIAEIFVKELNVAFARIWIVDETENVLKLQASSGLYTHIKGAHESLPIGGDTKISRVVSEKRPHISNSIQDSPFIKDKDWAREQGLTSFAGIPMVVEDRSVGALVVFSRDAIQ
ncbi:MAG: transporter substrate-binding domain-containing protein, partial [Deltaproteobacteria bacterium]|nr:transporter substrate-binding domain-containing protein [Deltaproteobacteria bacterium]